MRPPRPAGIPVDTVGHAYRIALLPAKAYAVVYSARSAITLVGHHVSIAGH